MAKVSNPCCHDHAAGEDDLSGLGCEFESLGSTGYGSNVGLFKIWDEALLKLKPVGDERIQRNRIDDVGVWKPLLLAEVLQREGGAGIVETRGEAKGFEEGALGHVISPTGHGASENAESYIASAQMRCNGEAVGACSDDHNVNFLSCHSFPSDYRKVYRQGAQLAYGIPLKFETMVSAFLVLL
jgi:hypothetical protein